MGLFWKKKKIGELEQQERPTTVSYEDLLRTVLQRHDLKTDHKGALAEFEAVSSRQPNTAEKFYWLGCLQYTIAGVLKDVGYVEKAMSNFEKALKLKPDYPQAYAQIIGAYMSKNDRNGVISTAKRWLKIDPNNETAGSTLRQYFYEDLWNNITQRYYSKKDYEGAMAEFEAACSGEPDTPEKLYWRGVLQRDIASFGAYGIEKDEVRRYYVDHAIADFEKVLQLIPPRVEQRLVQVRIGAYLRLLGLYGNNMDKVLSTAKRMLEDYPSPEVKGIFAFHVKRAASSRFSPWTSGGNCDVCGKPLRPDAAFQISVDVFYGSSKYRDWFDRNKMPSLIASGVPSHFTVDMVLADMRAKDQTTHSAVCEECVELFL